MKKLLIAVAMLFAITSFGQTSDKSYYFELATGVFVNNYSETGVNFDVGMFSSNSKWFPSLNFDVYTARVPEQKQWTTAQMGVRLNVPVVKHVLLSAGPKYVTQGGERNGYNQWTFDGAASWIHLLAQRDDGIMWLKLSVQYTSTPQQRVFYIAGLQFALR